MKKRLLCALLALVCLLSQAFAEEAVIAVNGEEITRAELKAAVRLQLFLGALRCAGYGYALDIVDPLTIEDEMEKVVYDLESRIIVRQLAAECDLALTDEDIAAAREEADAEWQEYRAIAFSDNGMAYLPAGDYTPADDPEETVTLYFASFDLTYDVLLQRACDDLLSDKLKAAYTDGLEGTEEELLLEYIDWKLEELYGSEVLEDDEAIVALEASLWEDD